MAGHQDSGVSGKRIEGGRWWICIFGIVTAGMEVYTLGRYAWEDTVFLYEVFRCLGDYIRSGGVFCATAFRGFEELYGLVFRSDDVRDRGGTANRRFQTDRAKTNYYSNRFLFTV